MELPFAPACRALAPASLPHRMSAPALDLLLRYVVEVPAWPELPQRDPGEQGFLYSALGFPGLTVDVRRGQATVRRNETLAALGELDLAYLENDLAYAAISPGQLAGFEALLRAEGKLAGALAVMGRLSGPVSLGLQLTDEQRRPLIYDELLFDALARYLRLRVGWQAEQLVECAPVEIICLDEPFLDAVDSAFVPLDWDQALAVIEEVLAGISGCRGLVLSGVLPWERLLATSVELIVVDPASAEPGLLAAAPALHAFIERGGAIAYAVVPSLPNELKDTDAATMSTIMNALFDRLAATGIARERLVAAAFVTPRGPLGNLTLERAEQALKLTAELSTLLRQQHGLT